MISAYTYVLFITMGKALWTFNCNKAHTAVTVLPRIFSKYTLMHSTMYHVLNRKLLGLEHVALYKHTQQGVPFSHLKCTQVQVCCSKHYTILNVQGSITKGIEEMLRSCSA